MISTIIVIALWLLILLIGLVFTLANARVYWHLVHRVGNDPAEASNLPLARAHLRPELLRLAVLIPWLVLGIVVFNSSVLHLIPHWLNSIIFEIDLLFGVGIITIDAITVWRDWRCERRWDGGRHE